MGLVDFADMLTRNKGAKNEAPVNGGVGEENEPSVSGTGLEFATGFSAGD